MNFVILLISWILLGSINKAVLETNILNLRILDNFFFKPINCFILNLTNSLSTYSMLLAQLLKREGRLFQPPIQNNTFFSYKPTLIIFNMTTKITIIDSAILLGSSAILLIVNKQNTIGKLLI